MVYQHTLTKLINVIIEAVVKILIPYIFFEN